MCSQRSQPPSARLFILSRIYFGGAQYASRGFASRCLTSFELCYPIYLLLGHLHFSELDESRNIEHEAMHERIFSKLDDVSRLVHRAIDEVIDERIFSKLDDGSRPIHRAIDDPGRTRTCNPRLRRPMPYPLGHGASCIIY